MKIKTDFVTNSSSTCFVLTMKSGIFEKVEFVGKLNEYFADLGRKDGLIEDRDLQPSVDVDDVERVSSDSFVIEGEVPYFRSYDDLPKHIKNLVLDYMNNPNGLDKFGIINLEFEVKDKNEIENK